MVSRFAAPRLKPRVEIVKLFFEHYLVIVDMENDNDLQDKILTTHHVFMHTFGHLNAIKIIENQMGIVYSEGVPLPKTN